ncbi:MAG: YegS/Rv2252/BmrU family lipid kinase [Cyclobacteriaceae bacterium]|nr:MAG: YegS/Rv2252/BmrU family lipid kinase [Cyclobacteriaceae bacterium]
MNIAIILNGISRKKNLFYQTILPALSARHVVEVFETHYAGHARGLAQQATENKFEVILSAGGDGTLHQVVNGVLDSKLNKLPTIGIIPLGSGNDFAGAVGVTANASLLLNLLEQGGKPTDVGLISCKDSAGENSNRYFINVCSLGMGPATVKQMEKAPAWLGVNGRYLVSILKTFFTHKPERLEVKTANWNWGGAVRVLAIANGKSFGNKIYLAPEAKQDDSLFNLFVAGDVPLLKFLIYLQTLKRRRKVTNASVYYAVADKVEITAPDNLAIEAEGEHVGFLPAMVEMKRAGVSFLR